MMEATLLGSTHQPPSPVGVRVFLGPSRSEDILVWFPKPYVMGIVAVILVCLVVSYQVPDLRAGSFGNHPIPMKGVGFLTSEDGACILPDPVLTLPVGVVHRAWRVSVLGCFLSLFSDFP